MIPLAAAETWVAVFGGLIPIGGLVAIGWIIWRAARDGDADERRQKR